MPKVSAAFCASSSRPWMTAPRWPSKPPRPTPMIGMATRRGRPPTGARASRPSCATAASASRTPSSSHGTGAPRTRPRLRSSVVIRPCVPRSPRETPGRQTGNPAEGPTTRAFRVGPSEDGPEVLPHLPPVVAGHEDVVPQKRLKRSGDDEDVTAHDATSWPAAFALTNPPAELQEVRQPADGDGRQWLGLQSDDSPGCPAAHGESDPACRVRRIGARRSTPSVLRASPDRSASHGVPRMDVRSALRTSRMTNVSSGSGGGPAGG